MNKYFKTKVVCITFLIFSWGNLNAQRKHFDINKTYVGELGVAVGAANYYGDLNPNFGLEGANLSGGIFYRYFFGDYFGASAHINYAALGYSDIHSSNNFRHTRNLSFNTSIWSFDLQADLNFFKFEPGNPNHNFTPFLSIGIGAFHFNPYTFYQDEKYYLQPLGTEGQNSAAYPDRSPYDLWTWEIPLEVGVKYNLNKSWNLFLSASYRFTGTDYLDDVSMTYVGEDHFFPNGTAQQQIAYQLQDRSGVYGKPIGMEGKARGVGQNKDQYILLQVGVSYLFTKYRCP